MKDLADFNIAPITLSSDENYKSVQEQLIEKITQAGLKPPKTVKIDGRVHRFSSSGRNSDDAGWYIVFNDVHPVGFFGCFRSGLEEKFVADTGKPFSEPDRLRHQKLLADLREARDQEVQRSREIAADKAGDIWNSCTPAPSDHPYLVKKKIEPHDLRVTQDNRLVCPIYIGEDISSLQFIDATGDKRFLPGGAIADGYMKLDGDDGCIYICEGFATGASIREATGCTTIVAYSAKNLKSVSLQAREAYGASHYIVIVADNDESGTGVREARIASEASHCNVIVSPVGDANDYANAGGDLALLLRPPEDSAIIEKLQAVFASDLPLEYEAPDELIEGLLTIGSSTVIYGDSNSGKTFFALSMAASIAMGTEFCGKQTDPGLVIYLASEAPGSIRSRLQAIKKFYRHPLENLVMVPVPLNFYESDKQVYDVIQLVRAVERQTGKMVRLIIGDTLARMSAGANENSAEDMGPVMARFESIAKTTGSALVIIHHNGKDAAKGARGWSGIRAHIDTEIEVVEKDGVRSATVTKQRELPSKGESIYFSLEIVEMGVTKFGQPATTCVAVWDESSQENHVHAKPTKVEEAMNKIRDAWYATGAEVKDGEPFMRRTDLIRWLKETGKYAERTVQNMVRLSRKDGLIAPLVEAKWIISETDGYVIQDPFHKSVFMMMKQVNNK